MDGKIKVRKRDSFALSLFFVKKRTMEDEIQGSHVTARQSFTNYLYYITGKRFCIVTVNEKQILSESVIINISKKEEKTMKKKTDSYYYVEASKYEKESVEDYAKAKNSFAYYRGREYEYDVCES